MLFINDVMLGYLLLFMVVLCIFLGYQLSKEFKPDDEVSSMIYDQSVIVSLELEAHQHMKMIEQIRRRLDEYEK